VLHQNGASVRQAETLTIAGRDEREKTGEIEKVKQGETCTRRMADDRRRKSKQGKSTHAIVSPNTAIQ